jgi:PAS domain S-box-containing protein
MMGQSKMGSIRKTAWRIFFILRGYLVAIALVALATWLKLLAQPNIIAANIPILYLLAIVPTAIYFGLGPSIVVCILSLFAYNFFFIPPLHEFNLISITRIQNAPVLAIFLMVGLLFSYLASNLRRRNKEARRELKARMKSERELAGYRDHLEDIVKQRTNELETANLNLMEEVAQRQKAEAELSRVNRALRATGDCHQVMLRATDELELFQDICRIICDTAGYRMAWVGIVEHDAAKSVRPVAWGGAEDGYLVGASITWADTQRGRGPTGLAVRTGKTQFFQDFATEPAAAPWREAALARGYRSSIAIPLSDTAGNVFGVFMVYGGQPSMFTPTEVELLEELAGDLAFGVSVLRDRTKREQAEESLRETSDYLNNLLDYANAPIIVWDPNNRITRFNHAFERLTGRTSSEVIGKKLDMLFPKDKKLESMSYIGRASSGERWETVEIPILHKDSSVRTVLWNSATLYSKDGETPIATIAQGHDITERRRIEEAMHLERDRLIGILNSMQDGVCIVNRDYDLEYVNPSMKAQYGDVDAQKCYQYLYGRSNVCPSCSLDEVFDGKTVQREAELSSTGRTYEITETPLRNVDGSTSKLAVYHDVTERKKIEQIKDDFIGMVSHELKTPITIVMGSIYTAMSEGISKDEEKQLLEDAASSVGSLADIVDNLLELSRMQADRLVIRKEFIDVGQIAHDVAEKLRVRSAAHKLIVDMPATLPEVSADQVRVERVLYNLMENAIKYSPDGGNVTVSARRRDDSLIICVKDQGIGISEEDQARLFQPFERLEAIKGIAGVGLGLIVCRRLVEAHGGQMWVESEPDHGSTFFFSLPLR